MTPFEEFAKLIKKFKNENISYILTGGIAMAFYSEPRFTRDIDIFINEKDFENIKNILEKEGYYESAKPWKFTKIDITLRRFVKIKDENISIFDLLIPSKKIWEKIFKNANIGIYDDLEVKIISKKDLIWLKSIRNSKQDLADIEKLKNEE